MGYYTQCTARVLGGKEEDREKILQEIKEKHYGSIDGEEVPFETQHFWNHRDNTEYKSLSKRHPDCIIEIDGTGDEYGDIWTRRFRDGEEEVVRSEIVDGLFRNIRTDDEWAGTSDALAEQLQKLRTKASDALIAFAKHHHLENGVSVFPYIREEMIDQHYFLYCDKHGNGVNLTPTEVRLSKNDALLVDMDTTCGGYFGTVEFPDCWQTGDILDLLDMLEHIVKVSAEAGLPVLKPGEDFPDEFYEDSNEEGTTEDDN